MLRRIQRDSRLSEVCARERVLLDFRPAREFTHSSCVTSATSRKAVTPRFTVLLLRPFDSSVFDTAFVSFRGCYRSVHAFPILYRHVLIDPPDVHLGAHLPAVLQPSAAPPSVYRFICFILLLFF